MFDTPAFQIVNVTEPNNDDVVTLEQIKSFSKIDSDYVSDDLDLLTIRDSVIERLEGYLNLFFSAREVLLQFNGGACKLFYGPQPIDNAVISVTKNDSSTPLDPSSYTISGLNYKTIFIGSEYSGSVNSWFYPIWGGWPQPWTWSVGGHDFYNVRYNTGFGTEGNQLPEVLKHSVLMGIDYFFKEQGSTEFDIPKSILQMANRFSKNLPIQ